MKKFLVMAIFISLAVPVHALEVWRHNNTATYLVFPMIDSADNVSYQSGCTSPDSEYEEWDDGAAPTGGFADMTGEITEIGTTGVYYLAVAAGEIDQDYTVVKVTCTDALTQTILIRTTEADPYLMATTDDGGTINVTGGAVDTVTTTTTATTATTCTNLTNNNDKTGYNVSSIDASTIGVGDFATGAITADAIATDAIGSAEFAQAAADKAWSTAARTLTAATNITDDGGTINVTAGAIDTVTDVTNGVTASTVSDKTGYSLAADQSGVTVGTVNALAAGAVDAAAIATDAIDADAIATDAIGSAEVAASALAKGTEITGFNDLSAAEVNAEVDTALTDIGLDHLLGASVTGTDVTDNSIVAYIVSKSATADWDSYNNTTDSLEGIADGGGGLTAQQVWEYNISAISTAGYAGDYLNNVGATVSSHSAADVWAVGTKEITSLSAAALADFFLVDSGTTYASAVAGSVVKETADNAGGSALTEAGIADAVWDEDIVAAHGTGDTAGFILSIMNARSATLSSDVDLGSIAGQTLDNGTAWSYDRTTDSLEQSTPLADAVDAIWDEDIVAAHNTADTAGEILESVDDDVWAAGTKEITSLSSAALSDFFLVDSGTTYSSAVAGSVVKETADNAGGSSLTEAGIADAVWDEDIIAAHGTGDTAGDLLSNLAGKSITWATDVVSGSIIDQMADDGTAVYDRTTDSLQAIADGGSGLTAADVWDYDIPSNYAPSGTSAGSVLDKLTEEATTLSSDVALGSVVGQMLDNGTAWSYDRTTDSQEAIADGGGGLTAAQVWDYDISSVVGAGYAGNYLNDLGTPNDFKADVSGLATSAALSTHDGKLDTVDANVDLILADTGTDGVVIAAGQTVATVTDVTNQVTADVTAVSGDSTAADNLEAIMDGTGATMTLTKLDINASDAGGGIDIDNDAGPGISATTTAANVYAIEATGSGATDSGGILAKSTVAGEGIEGVAAGNGHGAYFIGAGTGEGLHATAGGGANAHGAHFEGVGANSSGLQLSRGGVGGDDLNFANNDVTVANVTLTATTTAVTNAVSIDAASVDAVWDEATADHQGAGTTGLALTSGSAPTAAAVADAVWEEAIADHSGTAGSTAEQLAAAGNAGDPWLTDLPGAYTGDDAGYIVGSLLARDSTFLSAISEGVLINQPTLASSDATVTVYRGDAQPLTFNLGTDWNLTNKKVYLTVKTNKTDDITAAIINKECTVTDAVNGVSTITLAATDTATVGDYWYDLTVTDNDGTSNPRTAMIGVFEIKQDVR